MRGWRNYTADATEDLDKLNSGFEQFFDDRCQCQDCTRVTPMQRGGALTIKSRDGIVLADNRLIEGRMYRNVGFNIGYQIGKVGEP